MMKSTALLSLLVAATALASPAAPKVKLQAFEEAL